MAEALESAGLAGERERILSLAAGMANWWCLRAEAETSDAEHVLRQTMALQRSSGALNRELKLAEQALAADPTEQNLARLLDIKANLADLANAEAAIEGFGDLSGRGSTPLRAGARAGRIRRGRLPGVNAGLGATIDFEERRIDRPKAPLDGGLAHLGLNGPVRAPGGGQ